MLLRFGRAVCTAVLQTPKVFKGEPSVAQRRTAASVHEALVQIFARGTINDRFLENGAAIHVVAVHVAKGNGLARVIWEPLGAHHDVSKMQRALKRRCGILRAHVNAAVRQKHAIGLEFVPSSNLHMPESEKRTREVFEQLHREMADRNSQRGPPPSE